MKKLHLGIVKKQLVSCLQAFPVEALLGLCFFIMFVVEDSSSYPDNRYWGAIPFFFPTLFVIVYSFNSFFQGKLRFVYYLSLFTFVPLVLLPESIKSFVDTPAYGFTLLLTAFLLLGYQKTADNTSFARHCVKLIVNFVFAFAVGMLLMGMVSAIFFSVLYIFDLGTSETFLEYMLRATLYLFAPLLFCQLQQEDETELDTLPKIVEFVLNYILSPGIIIYTAILYLYFITIAIHWELPKGGVAYMVLAFIIVSFGGRMSQLIVSRRHYDWFYRPFSFIALPPLILFWIGTMHRIYAYDLTELRVYLLAAGVLMTLYVFFLQSKRLGNYRLMLLISSGVIVLLTYIPGISARSISVVSQANRMEHFARELSLWDAATGKLAGTDTIQLKDSAQLEMARQLNSSYKYLEEECGKPDVVTRYGINSLERITKNGDVQYYSRPDRDIPIGGYSRYLSGCRLYYYNGDTIEVKQDDRLLLEVDAKAHFAAYKDSMALWGRQAAEVAPFCLQNDSCLVVAGTIKRDEKGNYTIEQGSELLVFCK